MHDAIWGQIDGFKRAEIHQEYLVVVCRVFRTLTAATTKGAVEKELRFASEMVVCPAVMAACVDSCALSLHRAYDMSNDITHDIIL